MFPIKKLYIYCMFFKIKLLLLIWIISNYQVVHAQQSPTVKDSAKMFRKIEKYAEKRKFTRFIHNLIFEPVAKQIIVKSDFQKIKKQNYTKFEGKIIRNIKITTLDPFGYSDLDSLKKPKTFLDKSGNAFHAKTKNLAIKNVLLIKENKPLDSLLVKESERLIRNQRYVRNISSKIESVSKDSVDVIIRVLDAWSLAPNFSSSTTRSNFELSERNFIGSGHEFSNSFTKSLISDQNGYSTNYAVPTIFNTFISASLGYNIDLDANYSKYINIDRPFFSPYARWGAGINLGQNLSKIELGNEFLLPEIQNSKFNYQDYWAGHSYQIFKGNSAFDRATNLISSIRYFNKTFVEIPYVHKDSFNIYDNEKLYLIGVGISSRKFTQDKYIFNYNITEDVSSGFVYNLTAGYQKKFNEYQFYSGARIAIGSFYEYGYLSGNLEYGAFIKNGKNNQSTISMKLIYFTNLQKIGPWKFRQFIKPQIIIGNNRLENNIDKLTLNGASGVNGFDSNDLFGTKKMLITLQTQGYSPWQVLGFRLNPYFVLTAGMLGQKESGFKNSKVYSQIGLGVILSNDFLIFSTFQFSFSFYPNIPNGNSIFKTNAISTIDFGLQGFEISKPVLIDYR